MENNPVDNYNRLIGPKVNVINRVDMNKIITPKTTTSLDYLFFPEELALWVGCTVRTVTLLQWFGVFILIFSGLSFICNNQKKNENCVPFFCAYHFIRTEHTFCFKCL